MEESPPHDRMEVETTDTSASNTAHQARPMSRVGDALPGVRRLLAVIAHPDDESFGLGALLSAFIAQGTDVSIICFTRGESSTLGAESSDLASARDKELKDAARVLGIEDVVLLSYPDGRLKDVAIGELRDHVFRLATRVEALLVFDEGGVTGHPDHCRATAAALAAAEVLDLPVLAWSIPIRVAERLNEEFHTRFVGRQDTDLHRVLRVDRTSQTEAIACHASQTLDNPVLWRRLDLLGDREWLRFLRENRSRELVSPTIAVRED